MVDSEAQNSNNSDEKTDKKTDEKSSQPEVKKTAAKKTKEKVDKFEAVKKLFRSETEKLKKEVDAKDKDAKENYDKFLRLNAEFDNFKKRTQREKSDSFKYASEKIARDLIVVIDDLERALEASKKNGNVEDLSKGVEMILNQIKNILESNGAKQFDSLGQAFDPNKHEAVSKINTEEHEHNTVVEEFRKGYMLHDRLLRAAMVVVAENTGKSEDAGEETKTDAEKEEEEKAANN